MNFPKFKNQTLFRQAFTHRSFLNEVRIDNRVSGNKPLSNERLEFLGDSIISFMVSKYLYNKYPNFSEGTLTNLRSLLVNTKTLSSLAEQLNFGKLLLLSKGEEESKGRENSSLLENCFEAYVGALYLDQGLQAVTDFLEKILLYKSDGLVQKKELKDPKSLLQEKVQAQKHPSPVYKVISDEGPAHAKVFTVGVYINDKIQGKGIGKSKQIAEESAAKEALLSLEIRHK